jgi:chemotaxis protein CheD
MTDQTPEATTWFGISRSGLPQVFLMPGELYCATEPTVVTTALGSCVAVCLIARDTGLAGINHFLLPRGGASPRYGDFAIDRLIGELGGLGVRRAVLNAKVFGGAAVLQPSASDFNVGLQNIDVALARLEHHRIPIVASRIGGTTGLAIRLFTRTGRVLVKRIDPAMRRWE